MDDPVIFAVDWSHTEEKLAIYSESSKLSKKLPPPNLGMIIVTENMPAKMAKPYIDAGVAVLRCSPNATAKLREEVQKKDPSWEKTDENDVKLIFMLYKKQPNAFRAMKLDPPLTAFYSIFKDFQEVRIRTGNRLYADMSEQMEGFNKQIEKGEAELKKIVEKELQKYLVYTQWLSTIKGIGPAMAGGIIALVGDISRFDTISKLWAYAGYSVENGQVQKRKAGVASNWNGKIRTHCYNLVDQFIKQRTPVYREIYDQEKERQIAAGLKKGHAHNRAVRKTAKIFLQHYWLVSRQIAGLPVSQPWVIAHGGHVDYIAPPNWKQP